MLHFVAVDTNGQVLGHFTAFNGLHAHLLQRVAEVHQLLVAVQLATELQAARPCEDGGDGVGGSRLAGLVVAVVAGNGAVGGFRFHRLYRRA